MIIDVVDLNRNKNKKPIVNNLTKNESSFLDDAFNDIKFEVSTWFNSTTLRNKEIFNRVKSSSQYVGSDFNTLQKIIKYIDEHQSDSDTTIERTLLSVDKYHIDKLFLNTKKSNSIRSANQPVEIVSLDSYNDKSLLKSAFSCGLDAESELWNFLFKNKSAEINRWLSSFHEFKTHIQPGGKSAILTLGEEFELISAPLKRFEVIEEALGGISLFDDYPNITYMLAVDHSTYKFKQIYELSSSEIDKSGKKPTISEDELLIRNRGLIHKIRISSNEFIEGVKSGKIKCTPNVEAKISLLIDNVEKIRESSKDELIHKLAELSNIFCNRFPNQGLIPIGGIATELNKKENQQKIIKKIKKAVLDNRNSEKMFIKFDALMKRDDGGTGGSGAGGGGAGGSGSGGSGTPPENPQAAIIGFLDSLLTDGTQLITNPFGPKGEGGIMGYSFRPADLEKGYALIQICPASFQELQNLTYILNTMPYIIIQEFFLKNTASDVKNIFTSLLAEPDTNADPSSKDTNSLVTKAEEKVQKIKKMFLEGLDKNVDTQVLTLPWKLYHKMKNEMVGNEYHIPYIVNEDQYIAKSSNESQWEKNGGVLGKISDIFGGLINGSLAASLGVGLADVFPAPTWSGSADANDKFQISLNLTLLNDDYKKAQYNYMFANTIIHNNRIIQKSILSFPGALYRIILPTGTRCMMCTGTFSLSSVGINRTVPKEFFKEIGNKIGEFEAIHNDVYETIPDAYKLSIKFTSCIAANLNETIFGYYLDIVKFGVPDYTLFNTQSGTLTVPIIFDNLKISENKVMTINEELIIGDIENNLAMCYDVFTMLPNKQKFGILRGLLNKNIYGQDDLDKFIKISKGDISAKSSESNNKLVEKYSKEYAHLVINKRKIEKELLEIQDNLNFLNKKYEDVVNKKQESPLINRSSILINLDDINKKIQEERRCYENKLNVLFDIETNLIHLSKLNIEKILKVSKVKIDHRALSFYEQPELDAIEAAKWLLMTSNEREEYIKQLQVKIDQHDPNGIFKTDDWKLRSYAIGEIYRPMLEELSDLIRKYLSESDSERYEKAIRKYKLIKSDLDLAFDTSKPFKPCLIYIADVEKTPTNENNGIQEDFNGWGEYIFSDEASTDDSLDSIINQNLDIELKNDLLESENSRRSMELIEANWQSQEKFLSEVKAQFNKFFVYVYDGDNKSVQNRIVSLYGRYEEDVSQILGDNIIKKDKFGNPFLDSKLLTWNDIFNLIVHFNFKLTEQNYDKTNKSNMDPTLNRLNADLEFLVQQYNTCLNVAYEEATASVVNDIQKKAFDLFEKLTHGYYSEKDKDGKYSTYIKEDLTNGI